MSDDPKKTNEAPAVEAPVEEEKGTAATVERTSPCECVIRVEATAEYLEKRYREELGSVQTEVSLPGFRRGKAPVNLVERRMGRTVKNDVVSTVINECYDEAVEKNDLNVVNQAETPDLEKLQWEPGQPVDVKFRVEVLPQLEVKEEDYKGLEVEVPALQVTDELFQQERDRFAQQFATWEEVKTKGVDWDDYVEAEATILSPAWSQQVQFYPRAEKVGPFNAETIKAALADATVGDEVKLEVEVDAGRAAQDDMLKTLAGQKVTLNLTLKNVVRRHVPKVDDDLAQKLGLKDLAEIEGLVRERLQAAVAERKAQVTRHVLVDKLLEKVPFDLPASLVERAAEQEQARNLVRMLRMGVAREDAERRAADTSGHTRESVVRRLKSAYVLRKVAEKERVLVTESEVESQVRGFATQQGWRQERATSYLEERGMLRSLRDDMRESKTLDLLVANAHVKEISAEEFSKRHGAEHPGEDASAEND